MWRWTLKFLKLSVYFLLCLWSSSHPHWTLNNPLLLRKPVSVVTSRLIIINSRSPKHTDQFLSLFPRSLVLEGSCFLLSYGDERSSKGEQVKASATLTAFFFLPMVSGGVRQCGYDKITALPSVLWDLVHLSPHLVTGRWQVFSVGRISHSKAN
jgi:hypothetical protein